MPFVSKSQKRKFDYLLEKGKITQKQYDDISEGTPDDLPETSGSRPKVIRGRENKYRHVVKEVEFVKEQKPLGEK